MPEEIGDFEIIGIRDAGKLGEERLLLKAKSSVDTGTYIIITGKRNAPAKYLYLNNSVFWFPSGHAIKAGEYVRLYTKAGTYSSVESKFGTETAIFHNFYRGLTSALIDGVNADSFFIIKGNWNVVSIDV